MAEEPGKSVPPEGGAASGEVSLRLRRSFPLGHAAKPASHFVVLTPNEHEVTLLFYHVRPPILLGTVAEIEAELATIKGVDAECVAEIVIARTRLDEFVELLSTQLVKLKTVE